MKKIFASVVTWSTVLIPSAVLAQSNSVPSVPVYNPSASLGGDSPVAAVTNLFKSVTNVFATVVLALAVIFILVSAFNFITAGGDNEKIATARRTLIYALVGVAVAFLAFALPALVGTFIKGTN